MRKYSKRYLEKEVMRLDPKLEKEDPTFHTAVVLLAATQVGTNADAIAKYTGYNRDFVRERCRRLRQNGVWRGQQLNVEWFEPKVGGCAFWMDVCVAEGLMARSNGKAS